MSDDELGSKSGVRASRELMLSPSVESVARTNVWVPLPATNGVTSNSTQVFADTAPLSSRPTRLRAGRLPQLIAVSDQALSVAV